MRKTYRAWPVYCSCGFEGKLWGWSTDRLPCPSCELPLLPLEARASVSAAIVTDDIPGGLEIRHGKGMINEDGSPKRYYSRTELRRACNENGWTVAGDTPKPYRIAWSGQVKKNY